jgi:hypothetical protein
LTAVENAREAVNDKGEIQGILANETLSSRMDSGIEKVAEKRRQPLYNRSRIREL